MIGFNNNIKIIKNMIGLDGKIILISTIYEEFSTFPPNILILPQKINKENISQDLLLHELIHLKLYKEYDALYFNYLNRILPFINSSRMLIAHFYIVAFVETYIHNEASKYSNTYNQYIQGQYDMIKIPRNLKIFFNLLTCCFFLKIKSNNEIINNIIEDWKLNRIDINHIIQIDDYFRKKYYCEREMGIVDE